MIETILKLLDKYKKEDDNDMVVDLAQYERGNIKCYASTFSCEFKFLYLVFQYWKISWAIILYVIHDVRLFSWLCREYFCDIRSFESILVILTILMALQRFWQFIRYIFVILKVFVLFGMKMFQPQKRAFFLINRNLFSIWEYFPIALNAR